MSNEIEFTALEEAAALTPGPSDLARVQDVPVELAVEIGRTRMTIGETLTLGPGAIVSLNRLSGGIPNLVRAPRARSGGPCPGSQREGAGEPRERSGSARLVGGIGGRQPLQDAVRASGGRGRHLRRLLDSQAGQEGQGGARV